MKKEFKNLEDVAQKLGNGGDLNPDKKYETIQEVVDDLIELGYTDKVYAFYDDHVFLKDDLPDEFLNSSLDTLDTDKFEEEIDNVLEQANRIIPLANRTLSEDDIEEIKEDKRSNGEDIDI